MTAATATLDKPEDELALARAEVLAGDGERAVARLSSLLVDDGFSPDLHYWLSAAHGAAGQKSAQIEALRKAETLHTLQIIKESGGDLARFQADAAYAAAVGDRFYRAKLVACASLAFGRAAMDPGASANLLLSYGLSLQHQGRVEDAAAIFAVAAEAYPSPRVHEFLLFASFFVDAGVNRHAAEARRWAQRYAPQLDPKTLRFANARDANRRLRIGYVAPSFTGTQVRQFVLPVLDAHDPSAVEIFLYAADAKAEAGVPAADIRSIGGLTDGDAAALISADQIDVLVDLWGHTAGGRLGVLTLKPAPVQVAWINYVQTTGLTAIDYVIHCEGMEAPATAGLFVETVWTLGPIMAPFRADVRADPTPAPALRNGYVTFASFNNPAKLSDQTIAGWARVLLARPRSKLLLKYAYFADPVLQNATCARFAAHGVDPERLEFRGHTTGPDYLREFGDVDLALDPSPCPGGTTTSDAIAAGVPVLTLRGGDFYARIGLASLVPLGLPELVAESWDDYVAKAERLTENFEALNALRDRVRVAFDASPARDEAGFTRILEKAFREMFVRWCEKEAVNG